MLSCMHPHTAAVVLEAARAASWVARVAAEMAIAMKKKDVEFNQGQFEEVVAATHHKKSTVDCALASLLQAQGKA